MTFFRTSERRSRCKRNKWKGPARSAGLEFGHFGRVSGRGTEGGMSDRGASVGKIEEFFPLPARSAGGRPFMPDCFLTVAERSDARPPIV